MEDLKLNDFMGIHLNLYLHRSFGVIIYMSSSSIHRGTLRRSSPKRRPYRPKPNANLKLPDLSFDEAQKNGFHGNDKDGSLRQTSSQESVVKKRRITVRSNTSHCPSPQSSPKEPADDSDECFEIPDIRCNRALLRKKFFEETMKSKEYREAMDNLTAGVHVL